jgi:hypothetical protein
VVVVVVLVVVLVVVVVLCSDIKNIMGHDMVYVFDDFIVG